MNGYLYIINRPKFKNEALISVRSLRRFNTDKIAVVCPEKMIDNDLKSHFDIIIVNDDIENYTYLSKVLGLKHTPFDKTLFLDSDTFITDDLSALFSILDIADFATTIEPTLHTTNRINNIRYQNIIPEFNSGVILYKNNKVMKKVIDDWFKICTSNNIINDMPGLREAVLDNFDSLSFTILPNEYNAHGFKTFLLLYQKVIIIHERLGYKWNVRTPHFLGFEKMQKFEKMINRKVYKRLYIPYIGIIPYNWSLLNILLYFKRKLGFKRISKSYSK